MTRRCGGVLTFVTAFSQKVNFTGSTGELALGDAQSFDGKITGFSTTGSTSIDLRDIGFVWASEASSPEPGAAVCSPSPVGPTPPTSARLANISVGPGPARATAGVGWWSSARGARTYRGLVPRVHSSRSWGAGRQCGFCAGCDGASGHLEADANGSKSAVELTPDFRGCTSRILGSGFESAVVESARWCGVRKQTFVESAAPLVSSRPQMQLIEKIYGIADSVSAKPGDCG